MNILKFVVTRTVEKNEANDVSLLEMNIKDILHINNLRTESKGDIVSFKRKVNYYPSGNQQPRTEFFEIFREGSVRIEENSKDISLHWNIHLDVLIINSIILSVLVGLLVLMIVRLNFSYLIIVVVVSVIITYLLGRLIIRDKVNEISQLSKLH